jgi:hypothetical protein
MASSSELHNAANRACETYLRHAIEILKECSALCVLTAEVFPMRCSARSYDREEVEVCVVLRDGL